MLLQTLRQIDSDRVLRRPLLFGQLSPRRLPLGKYIERMLKPLIDVEGKALFADVDAPGWAEHVLEKLAFFDYTFRQYCSSDTPGSVDLDRSNPTWQAISRRNVSLPKGLAYEVAVVIDVLSMSDPPAKISFSGFLELAVRELLKRPINPDDRRYRDDDPAECQTIQDAIARERIGMRRKFASNGQRDSARHTIPIEEHTNG